MTTLRTLTETASELGKEARESMEEFGRSAGKKLDEARDETGDALHAAASSVRTNRTPGFRGNRQTALPARRIDWMLRRHSSKITTWGMRLTACGGSLAGI